jgi:hypothetical protein
LRLLYWGIQPHSMPCHEGGKWSASHPGCFTLRYPLEMTPGRLNAVERGTFLSLPGFELRPLSCPTCSQCLYLLFLCQQVKETLDKVPPELVGKPLFVGVLSDKQWHQLSALQQELQDEYCMRREMLIKRLDVTIQSFRASTNYRIFL